MVHSSPRRKQKLPKIFGENLQFCFSKPKIVISNPFPPTPLNPSNPSSLISKHIPTYYNLPSSKSFTPQTSDLFSSDSESDSKITAPDFSTILASQRFFSSPPGRSNSIVHSADSVGSAKLNLPQTPILAGAAVPFWIYSSNPYLDFRRSMSEMVESEGLFNVKEDWDHLHELLLCYLELNHRHFQECIIAAFTDVLVSISSLPESTSSLSRRKSDVSDYCSRAGV